MATTQQIATMAQPLLIFGYLIVFEAIDPDTGAAVTGVTVTDPNLSGINLSEVAQPDEPLGPFMLVPGPQS